MMLDTRRHAALSELVDAIFPAAPDGTSGSDLGVVDYICGLLDGPWGTGASWYADGPHLAPRDPNLGWQSALRPSDVYHAYLDAIEGSLTTEPVESVIAALHDGTYAIGIDVRPREFFDLLVSHVVEGMFRDPCFGGNRDGAGWAWLAGSTVAHP